MHGPGNSGKDVLHSLLFSLFGTSDQQYACALPSRTFVADQNRDPEAPTCVLEMLRVVRHTSNNEVPGHKEFASAFEKSLTEEKGSGQVGREIRENTNQLLVQANINICNNHCISLPDLECEPTSDTSR